MKKIYYYTLVRLGMLSLPLLFGCTKSTTKAADRVDTSERHIQFAGYDWIVRSTGGGAQGPGPNHFSSSEQNVWVDHLGRLHLRITKVNGVWYSAEVTLRKVYGFARYAVELQSSLGHFDPQVVGAFFIYKNDTEEADIEFSTWGKPGDNNAQYVIQPGDQQGNKYRFMWPNEVPSTSVHMIDWQESKSRFASYTGKIADTATAGHKIATWEYQGADNPRDQDARVKLNLWLFKGQPPTDGMEAEMVVSDFKLISL